MALYIFPIGTQFAVPINIIYNNDTNVSLTFLVKIKNISCKYFLIPPITYIYTSTSTYKQ